MNSISTNVSSSNLFQNDSYNESLQQKKSSIQSSRPPLARRLTTQQSQRQPARDGLNFQHFEKLYNNGVTSLQNTKENTRVNSLQNRRNSNSINQQEKTNSRKAGNQSSIIDYQKENDMSIDNTYTNQVVLHQRRANLGSKTRIQSAKPFNDNNNNDCQQNGSKANFSYRSNSQNKYDNKQELQLSIQIKTIQKPTRDIQSAKSSNNSLVRAGMNILGGFKCNLQQRTQSKQSNRSDANSTSNRAVQKKQITLPMTQVDQEEFENTIKQKPLTKQSSISKLNEPFEYKRQNSEIQKNAQQIITSNQNNRLRRLNSININIPLPHITAQSWSIYDSNSLKFVQGKKENYKREVASITKMMTFYTCLQLMSKYNIGEETLLTVSRTASRTNGTSACLREGDQLTIDQLFYGLMLPSGNDAAYCLAEYFGQYLQENKYKDSAVTSFQFQWSIVRYFLKEMNLNAFKLRMFSSQFDSPHGLANKHNYSTSADICLLAQKSMLMEKFRKVVNTIEMKTEAKSSLNGKKLTQYTWENTNKLLGQIDGFIGCKTGITNPAGPCFCGGYEKDSHKYIVVVLSSKSMESRWVEVPKMIEWAIKKKKACEEAKNPISNKQEDQTKFVRIL